MSYLYFTMTILILSILLVVTGLVFQSRTPTTARFATKSSLPSLYDMVVQITKLDSPLCTPAVYSFFSAGSLLVIGVIFILVRNFLVFIQNLLMLF